MLANAHAVVLHYALAVLLEQEQVPAPSAVQWQGLENLFKKGEGKCSLNGGVTACLYQGTFVLEKEGPSVLNNCVLVEPTCNEYVVAGKRVWVERTQTNCQSSHVKVCSLLTYNGPDCDKIGTSLQLRTRREGDKIRLAHRGCTKSLKKLFNECKMPHSLRKRCLVLCDNQGVLWVEGIGCDARCVPTKGTKHQLIITVQSSE